MAQGQPNALLPSPVGSHNIVQNLYTIVRGSLGSWFEGGREREALPTIGTC